MILFITQVFSGTTTLAGLAKMFLGNFLRNGFSEEFYFRGALQTRSRVAMNSNWTLIVQALLFGIWHLGIAYRGILGLTMGTIFRRTHNLTAPSVIHVVINMFGN